MNSVRLLPVVIVAIFALLVFKGISLVTEGAYVLSGTTEAEAAGGTEDKSPAEEDGHGASPAGDDGTEEEVDPLALPEITEPPLDSADRASQQLFENVPAEMELAGGAEDPMLDPANGSATTNFSATEQGILERLSERRTELEALAEELDAREVLVTAAEKRLEERVASLEAIEARIAALVEERKGQDGEDFAAIVSMYETMKPGDAASIFDELQMDVLVRVARAMNPRKMAPVMAKMGTERAQDLTLRLAAQEPEPTMDVPLDQLESLPQIVGQ